MSRDARFRIPSRWFRSGRFWTICAAAWWSLQLSCCWCSAGWCCPAIRCTGRWQRWAFCLCRPGSSSCSTWCGLHSSGNRNWSRTRARRCIDVQCQRVFYAVVSAASDAALARCRGANTGAAAGDAAPLARMGDRGRNRTELPASATPVDIYLDWMPAAGCWPWASCVCSPAAVLFSPRCRSCCCGLQQMDFDVAEPADAGHAQPRLRQGRNVSWREPRCAPGATFAEFSTEEHNWLIPDNVQEEPAVGRRPHVAYQSGISFERTPGGVRIRISDCPGICRTDSSNSGNHGEASAVSRTSAQLV